MQVESLEERKEPAVQQGRSEYKGSRIEWEKFPEVSSNWYGKYQLLGRAQGRGREGRERKESRGLSKEKWRGAGEEENREQGREGRRGGRM